MKRLHLGYTTIHETIVRAVLGKHQVKIEDLPDSLDVEACATYRPSLCRDKGFFGQPPDMAYFWSTTPNEDGLSKDGSLSGKDAELESDGKDDVSEGNSSVKSTLELVRFNSVELIASVWLTLRTGYDWTGVIDQYDTSR